jgi:hypothetical protein
LLRHILPHLIRLQNQAGKRLTCSRELRRLLL